MSAVVLAPTTDALAAGRYMRMINFHNTTRARAPEYERQLASAGSRFSAVTEDDLLALLDGQPWTRSRPGLIPVLYEGYRNTYEVALPLVEKAGLCAWFVVPSAFIDAPVPDQRAMAERCTIDLADDAPRDGRFAMSWDELRDVVARGHSVVCHTAHHVGIADLAGEDDIQRELVDSRARLQERLDREIRGLAFLWGTPRGLDDRVDAAVVAAGYQYLISNTMIQSLRG